MGKHSAPGGCALVAVIALGGLLATVATLVVGAVANGWIHA